MRVCSANRNQFINDVLPDRDTTCPAPENQADGRETLAKSPNGVSIDHGAAPDPATENQAHVHDDKEPTQRNHAAGSLWLTGPARAGGTRISCSRQGAKAVALDRAS